MADGDLPGSYGDAGDGDDDVAEEGVVPIGRRCCSRCFQLRVCEFNCAKEMDESGG